jgi:hypothetical protein
MRAWRAGWRKGGVAEVGEERGCQTNLGLRLEFVAEVRRAVGKGSARPNMVKGRRRKVSSADLRYQMREQNQTINDLLHTLLIKEKITCLV